MDISVFITGLAGSIWAQLSGLGSIAVLIAAGLGAFVTYTVQSRTQKRTWKREATLRKIDTIYGPIYGEIMQIAESLSSNNIIQNIPPADKWDSIKGSYYYRLLDKDLRKELDDFYGLLKQAEEKQISLVNLADTQLVRNLRDATKRDVTSVSCEMTFVKSGRPSTGEANLFRSIANGEHPTEYARKAYPGQDSYDLKTTLHGPQFHRTIESADEKRIFDAAVLKTVKKIGEDPDTIFLKDANSKMLEWAPSLKSKLGRIIEEPWRV